MGQHAPVRSSARQPAQRVDHLAQAVLALGRVLINQGQVGRDKVLFLVAHVTGVGLSAHRLIIRMTRENQP